MIEIINAPASYHRDLPEEKRRELFKQMTPMEQIRTAADEAVALLPGEFDPDSIYVERVSFHPDDWYLWTAAARKRDEYVLKSQPGPWAVWTLNLSLQGLFHGHYDLNTAQLRDCLIEKKGGRA